MEDLLSKEEHAKQLTARQRQDFEDQQNELMGNDTGRQARFLGGKNSRVAQLEKKRKEQMFRDVLEMLLQDSEYRKLYEELGETLGAAESNADRVIAGLESDLADLRKELDQMLEDAPRLPGGGRAFRFADGRVIDEHGREVAPEIAEGIVWPPGAQSAENYLTTRDRETALNVLLGQWQDYRNDTLGSIRDRYDDRENPAKDTATLEDDIMTIVEGAPPLSLAPAAPPTTAGPVVSPNNVLVPDI